MKASIVIPVYNMAQYVGQCIDSVLCQSCSDWEIILVDDCSTDNSVEIIQNLLAKDSRIVLYCRDKNGGVSAALNDGFKRALGDYICPLGADDVLLPWMVEKQSAYLDAHPEIAAVFGMPLPMTNDGTPIEGIDRFTKPANRSRAEWFATLMEANTLMGQTMLYRRSLHDTLGYWDEKLSASNDIDWFIRIVKEHDIHVQHQPMACIRMRDGDKTQLSADTQSNRAGFFDDMEYIRAKHKPEISSIGYTGKLLIATPVKWGNASARFINSLLASVRCFEKLGIEWDWWHFDAGSDATKNGVCAKFLESHYTDLLFIDGDLEWGPLGLLRVLTNEHEVVCGSHQVGKKWTALPVIKNGSPQGIFNGDNPLLEAYTISSDFLRLKRSALEKFRAEYPQHSYHDERSGMASDYRLTAFFDASCGDSGDKTFLDKWSRIGKAWIEPQIEFKTESVEIVTRSLDQHYRDLKEQQKQLKVA